MSAICRKYENFIQLLYFLTLKKIKRPIKKNPKVISKNARFNIFANQPPKIVLSIFEILCITIMQENKTIF